MKQIIKQSILLEEHLGEDPKYCLDCCNKHFLHILGLAEEALLLAGKDLPKHPHMCDCAPFYQTTYDAWSKNTGSKTNRLKTLTALRKHRKMLMDQYL